MREHLVRCLDLHGYDIRVITACAPNASSSDCKHLFLPTDAVQTIRGPLLTISWRNLRLLWTELNQCQLLILSGTYSPLLAAAAVLGKLQTPVLYIITTNAQKAAQGSFRGVQWMIAQSLFELADRLLASLATHICARSSESVQTLQRAGISADSILVQTSQYNAFRRPQSVDSASIDQARVLLSAGQPEKVLLLYVGRFSKEKRIPMLVRARPAGAVLAIVGDWTDEEEC